MKKYDGPSLVVLTKDLTSKILRPANSLTIGRHSSNDVVLNDPTFSRFHAKIKWLVEQEYPVIYDCDSTCGLLVDGLSIKNKTLASTHQIHLGNSILIFEYRKTESDTPTDLVPTSISSDLAILEDSTEDNSVKIFSEERIEKGRVRNNAGLINLILRLEEQARTGSLRLSTRTNVASLVFGNGKIMSANINSQTGIVALCEIFALHTADFEFNPTFDVEESYLNISACVFLSKIRRAKTKISSRK